MDPSPYQSLRTSSINAIKSSKYQWVDLKNTAVFTKEIVNNASELPYVGLENIESNTGFYVPSEEKKGTFNSALKFEVGDVLFPKLRPYLNKVHLAQFEGVCSTEFYVLKGINLNNLYLSTFLSSKLVLNQTTCLMTGNTLPRLQTQEVKRLPILIPPPEIQNNIAEIMQSAYTAKKQKDQEADAILDSIDDYVLTELGIEMPAVEEQKCFVVYTGETTGRRIGVRFHHRYFLRLREQLYNSNFPVKNLGDLTSLIYRYLNCYGFSCYDSPSDTRVPFLQVGDINATRISDEHLIFIDNEISEKYPKTILKSGDLIFSVRGTIGKVAVVTHEFENSNINPNLIRLSLNEEVNPQYVEIVLNSKIGQKQINRLISGGVQPTFTKADILSLEIPLPVPEIQEQIAEESLRLRSEATKLRQEADAIVEQAKAEVEQILLAEA